jgi:hypothetical protein
LSGDRGLETAGQRLSRGWLCLAAHPVRYVLADHDAGEVDVRAQIGLINAV